MRLFMNRSRIWLKMTRQVFSTSGTRAKLPGNNLFNTVSSGVKIHNLFGSFGAYTADMLLQTLGLSSYFFAVAFIAWGHRILVRKPFGNLGGKISLLIVAVLTGAIAFARVPSFESW